MTTLHAHPVKLDGAASTVHTVVTGAKRLARGKLHHTVCGRSFVKAQKLVPSATHRVAVTCDTCSAAVTALFDLVGD